MKIAVIGGTGLIGPYLLPRLINSGHVVTCLNRRGTSSCSSAVSCDRRDGNRLRAVLKDLEPQVVIDMVPYTKEDAEILCDVLDSGPEIQVIAISSIDVYQAYGRLHHTEPGDYQKCPIKEEDALRQQLSFQGEDYDKLNVEKTYRLHFENLSILRMPAIYGWPDQFRVKQYYDAVSKENRTLRMNPEFAKWGFTRASAQDCALATSLSIGQLGHHVYNVGEEELLSEEEWCLLVWEACGRNGKILYDKDAPIPFDADLKQGWHVDTTKIRSELGYSEESNRIEILRDTIQKMQETEDAITS
ncbi:MAG: NAD-dependent epimerase/dehydratase family protein [Verrucomicrobiota bacterium]